MEKEINLYNLKENRKMKPSTFANLVASALYEKRLAHLINIDLDHFLLLP